MQSLVPCHPLHGGVVDFEDLISWLQAAIFICWATWDDLLDVNTIQEGVSATRDDQTKNLVSLEDDDFTLLKGNDICGGQVRGD